MVQLYKKFTDSQAEELIERYSILFLSPHEKHEKIRRGYTFIIIFRAFLCVSWS